MTNAPAPAPLNPGDRTPHPGGRVPYSIRIQPELLRRWRENCAALDYHHADALETIMTQACNRMEDVRRRRGEIAP